MFRPSGTIVLPFWIKKASLALRMESRLEEISSMGINCMSLAVCLVEDRKCSAAVVGLDLVLGLSMVRRCSLKRSFKRRLVSPMYCLSAAIYNTYGELLFVGLENYPA